MPRNGFVALTQKPSLSITKHCDFERCICPGLVRQEYSTTGSTVEGESNTLNWAAYGPTNPGLSIYMGILWKQQYKHTLLRLDSFEGTEDYKCVARISPAKPCASLWGLLFLYLQDAWVREDCLGVPKCSGMSAVDKLSGWSINPSTESTLRTPILSHIGRPLRLLAINFSIINIGGYTYVCTKNNEERITRGQLCRLLFLV